MLGSTNLGKLFGIDVYVHSTFWLLPLWVFFSRASEKDVNTASFEVAVLLAVFGCVILHEIGHALAARIYGIPTRDITLYPIGGIARLERFPQKPSQEIVIALAGPAVNVAIAGIILAGFTADQFALHAAGYPLDYYEDFGIAGGFLERLFIANLFLCLFNLLPAFPMDGGRVLRAVLNLGLERVVATRIAVGVGGVVALGFCLFGLFPPVSPMLIFLGVVVFLLGRAELASVTYEEAQRSIDRFRHHYFEPVGNNRFTGWRFDAERHIWTEWLDGRMIREVDARS